MQFLESGDFAPLLHPSRYRKAADQGNTAAQCNLGVLFDQGRGVAQSDAEAARW
jgi:TPR repeat protein